jgi:hypothetical protein
VSRRYQHGLNVTQAERIWTISNLSQEREYNSASSSMCAYKLSNTSSMAGCRISFCFT